MRKVPPGAWIWMSLTSICGGSPLIADNYHLNNHWELLGDFVFMRRSEVHNKRLVKDSDKPQCSGQCPNFTVISAGNLVNDFDFEPGYRVGLTYIADARNGFEWNFLYIYPWHGDKKAKGNQSLSFPFSKAHFTQDFRNASVAQAEYESQFWNLEFNYRRSSSPRRADFFSLSGLAGLRYVHWNEEFELKMFRPPDRSSYNISTKNRIFGVQIGADLQWNPTHWLSWEAFAKFGGMVNHAEQETFLGDLDNSIELRDFHKQKRGLGVYTDIAAQFAIHINRHFNIHAGYQFMFFSGLALAPEQISKRGTRNAGNRVYDDGSAIIHGLFVGVILAF
jgi:hypothetical protein